jgi:hypothetical protein
MRGPVRRAVSPATRRRPPCGQAAMTAAVCNCLHPGREVQL